MSSANFRKIDVDALEEDHLQPEDLYLPYSLDPSSAAQQAKQIDSQVRGLVPKGDSAGALQLLLQDPPYGNEAYAQAKATALQTLIFIVLSTSNTNIDSVLSSLAPEQQDSLMKYLYAAMHNPVEGATGNAQCAAMLNWHAKLTALAGVGCIGRAMVDQRRVV